MESVFAVYNTKSPIVERLYRRLVKSIFVTFNNKLRTPYSRIATTGTQNAFSASFYVADQQQLCGNTQDKMGVWKRADFPNGTGAKPKDVGLYGAK